MRKKNKAEQTEEKVKTKRWGVGKTLAIIISSVAFVVGAAVLGVYLGRGFDEDRTFPNEIVFDAKTSPNFNADLNRLEISTQEIDQNNSFKLTITSSTTNITAGVVELDSVSTYAYNANQQAFASDFLAVNREEVYIDNGIIRFPKHVTVGQPFEVYLSTYRCSDTPDGSVIDQIRGGITTISAKSENGKTDELTIAVDTPVFEVELYLTDKNGNEIKQTNGIFEVTEEEDFYVETKFYPAHSRYVFSKGPSTINPDAEIEEKTVFYDVVNNDNVTQIFDSATSKHFYAERITDGVKIDYFAPTNARMQQQIYSEVAQMGQQSDNSEAYRQYLLSYSAAASDEKTSGQVKTGQISLDIVQASVDTFEVGLAGQTFNLHDQAPLRIYVGDYQEQPRDKFLSTKIKSTNGMDLNNMLQNVVVSFSLDGQDPTDGENAIVSVEDGERRKIEIDGVYYYKAIFGNPENYGTGFWELTLEPNQVGKRIIMTVSLLLKNEEGGYDLFKDKSEGVAQHTIVLETVEHVENPVSWTDESARKIVLTYAPNSSIPTQAEVPLEGLTEIPEENIYWTPKYFVSFAGLDKEQSVERARQMFDGQIEENFAGTYNGLIMVPLSITNDVLYISEVGQFDLYFATTNGFEEGQYKIVQMVANAIPFEVTKTLYINSVSASTILYKGAEEQSFTEITEGKYLPTKTDNEIKDQIQVQFTIAADSVEVFKEEFANGYITLKLFAGQSDVTSYFLIEQSSFAEQTNEDGSLTLTYTLRADESFSVTQESLSVTLAQLEYRSTQNRSNNLTWPFENLYDGGTLNIYTPAAQKVELNADGVEESYTVKQTLNEEGLFEVSITGAAGEQIGGLPTLIGKIRENITVTDQFDKTDTLENSWYFTSSNTTALQITTSEETGGKPNQGFSFTGEGNATLGVACGDQSAENSIAFDISAVGITAIKYDADNPREDSVTEEKLTNYELLGNQEIVIEKYGAAGADFTIDNLIKFYVGKGDGQTEYKHVTFKLSPTYFAGKDDSILQALFGADGMIKLNGIESGDCTQSALGNIPIESIAISHNFAQDHSITLLATDKSGAVSRSITLSLLSNIASSSMSTSMSVDANVEATVENSISYRREVDDNTNYPRSYLSNGSIVPNENGDGYIVVPSGQNAVGSIENGNVTFNHIFAEEKQTFSVKFTPEVDNVFALSATTVFTVSRNIKVGKTDQSIQVFAEGAQNFKTYITVSEKEGAGDGFSRQFALPKGNNVIEITESDPSQFQVSQNVRFDYGKTSLTQKVIVYVYAEGLTALPDDGNYYSQEVELEIVLPDDFWDDVASAFTHTPSDGSTTEKHPSHQVFTYENKTKLHYLVVESIAYSLGSYTYTADNSQETVYTITSSQQDGSIQLGSIYNYYDMGTSHQLSYKQNNNLLYGYNNQSVYTLLIFTKGGKTITFAAPTIVSAIGTTFVSYGDKSDAENSLANAMKSAEQLFEEKLYKEVTAGDDISLYLGLAGNDGAGIFKPENINLTLSESVALSEADKLPSNSSLFKNFAVADGKLTLNHLSNEYNNAYLALTYTLEHQTTKAQQTFNYLLKVEPDVQVSAPNYPYATGSETNPAEYISFEEINLDEQFGETTANSEHYRFEILKDGQNIGNDLEYQDSIHSVKLGDVTYTNPSDWIGSIDVAIENTAGQSTLKFYKTPTELIKIEIVVRRSYIGGERVDELSVVGGTIDYRFVINDDKNYSLRAEHEGGTENDLKDGYTWTINNWAEEQTPDQTLPEGSVNREKTRKFFLIEGWSQDDGVEGGSKVAQKLFFNLHEPDGEGWRVTKNDGSLGNSFTATYTENGEVEPPLTPLTFTFEYDNSIEGPFKVTYPEYLSREYRFSATFFTDHGKLATIDFVFKPDAQEKDVKDSFTGGNNYGWNEIFTLKENGVAEEVSGYNVVIDSFTGADGENYKSFVNSSDGSLQIASVVQDLTGDLKLTVTWEDGKKSYTFTISDFTITKNLEPQSQETINAQFDTQIGGNSATVTAEALLQNAPGVTAGSLNTTLCSITLSAQQPSDSAIENVTPDGDGNLTVEFNQVGAETPVTIPVTVTVTPNFGASAATINSTEIVVDVTFVIYPSVKIEAVYPSPDDTMLEREYIENNTKFSGFATNFLGGRAVFADEDRIKVKYASFDAGSDSIVYNTNEIDSVQDKRIIISSITNATVTRDGENEPLEVNSEIGSSDTIKFSRGSSGGTSAVTLSISYNNYVISYVIEIRDSLFNLSVNPASNNLSGDTSGSYENIYVDKTETTDLFAKNRMAEVVLSDSAPTGDYYIFFETQQQNASEVYISKVINLSNTFVNGDNSGNSGNKGKTIYLDLGLNNLGDLTERVTDSTVADLSGGKYRAYMFADSYYQEALEKATDEAYLEYLKGEYASRNVFDQMFKSFKLSSRVTLTYADNTVDYDEYKGKVEYRKPNNGTGSALTTPFTIVPSTDVKLGVKAEGVDQFTFSYSNGGTIVETETRTDPSITKTFYLEYDYMPDFDINVGMAGQNKEVEIEVYKPVRIVEAFDITRKSSGQRITMDDMVSGGANFKLVEADDDENTINGKRYIGISYVQNTTAVDEEPVVYDIELRGNGAPNEGHTVNFTLTYSKGGFSRTFDVTVKVVPDYRFSVNGRPVDLGENTAYSNIDAPYEFTPDDSTPMVLAGEDYEDKVQVGEGEETIIYTPYLSVTHANDAYASECSVDSFAYTMTVGEAGGYNIEGNIDSKLNIGTEEGKNNWNTATTTYTWNKGSEKSLVFEKVVAVEFGKQYYHLVAVDDYGYKFDFYFTLSSDSPDVPTISTQDGALSFTEGQSVNFGALYEELSVQLEEGSSGNLEIISKPDTPTVNSDSGIEMILIQNLEAWGFVQSYYKGEGNEMPEYFGSDDENEPYNKLSKNKDEYAILDSSNKNGLVGKIDGKEYYLHNTESQKYLKVPNLKYVTIDEIEYLYQDQPVSSKSSESSEGLNGKIVSDNQLVNAAGTGANGGYYSASDSADGITLNLPKVKSDCTWIYGTGNSVQVTMVVTLKYSKDTNTEYYQMRQEITLSKTSQITSEKEYVADNTEIDLSQYIKVTDGGNGKPYDLYDDTLAVAVKGGSTTTFDLTYNDKTTTLSAGNGAVQYDSLYYLSISEAFGTVLADETITITITPHDQNGTFYYGYNSGTGGAGNKGVTDQKNQTSFTKVADADFFRVETKSANGDNWTEYTTNIPKTTTGEYYEYDSFVGGYKITNTDVETITITESNLGEPTNFRVLYNGIYYYPQLELTIETIGKDRITIANHNQLDNNGEMVVNQYYVVKIGDTNAYRYRHQFKLTGTFKSIESASEIHTLPAPTGSELVVTIDEWAEGVTYTQIQNGEPASGKDLRSYKGDNGDNLYFNITSDQTGGGSGYATIDSSTGTITLKPGFTASHYIKVQIYQKVSGIDGSYGDNDINQMQLLKEIYVYPANAAKISGGGEITLSEHLPAGTYYENTSHAVTIPAYTKADLVVKNGSTEVNRILLQNDTAAEKTQTYTLAALLGKTIYNYKPPAGEQDGLTLSIENAQVSKSGYSITMTQNGNTQNINLGEEFYLEARTGMRSITTSKDTDHVTIFISGQLVNTIKVDETWQLFTDQLKRKEFTLLELLDGKSPDDFSNLYMSIYHFAADGTEMPEQEGVQNVWVWTAEDFAFDITLKSETSAWIVTHNDYVKSDGTNETLKLHQTAGSQNYTYNDLHMYWVDSNNERDHEGDRLLTNSRRITFDHIEIADFSAFKINGIEYNGAVNITPTSANEKTSDTILFENGNVTTKTYIILLSENDGSKTLTFRSISFKNQVSITGG